MRLVFDTGQNFSMFLAARVIFVTVLLGVAFLFRPGGEPPLDYAMLLLINTGLSLGCWQWFRRGGPAILLRWLALTAAVCIDTIVLRYAGGPDSEFIFLYFFSIGAAGILTGLAGSLWTALLSGAGFAWLIHAASSGGLAERGLHVLIYSIHFLLTALLTAYVYERLKERERSHARALGDLAQTRLDTQAILDSLNSGILVLDPDGRTMYSNPAGRAILELPNEENAAAIAKLLAPLSTMGSIVRELMADPRPENRAEFDLHAAGGSKPIGLSVSPLQDRTGQSRGHIILFGDLTRVKEAERSERERERLAAIGRLSRDLAHEIRNPLATIRGSVEMLRTGKSDPAEQSAFLDLALRESDRLNVLLKSFLVFAHLDTPRKRRADLAAAIRERLMSHRDEFTILDQLPYRLERDFDPDQIVLVIEAILLSLAEWGEGKGTIRAEQNPAAGESISFLLESVVVPQATCEAVFQPFSGVQRFSNGLAVPTAWRAVHAHGGRLSLLSETGIGTWYELAI